MPYECCGLTHTHTHFHFAVSHSLSNCLFSKTLSSSSSSSAPFLHKLHSQTLSLALQKPHFLVFGDKILNIQTSIFLRRAQSSHLFLQEVATTSPLEEAILIFFSSSRRRKHTLGSGSSPSCFCYSRKLEALAFTMAKSFK